MALLYFDVNVIVAIRVVKFLEYELLLWKKKLNDFLKTCSTTNHKQLVKYLKDVSYEEKQLLNAYSNIIGAFKLCHNVFGMSILLLMVEGFGHPLIYIQLIIDVAKSSTENAEATSITSLLVTFIWILKSVTLISLLCVACQNFYLTVADVETACSVVRCDEGCLVSAHRLSKNVQRFGACVGARRMMRPFNLVSVSAATPLHMLTVLVTYTVVLLQFAFL
ncbi:uncharacterized protein LOC125242061 [Leguminivora glycinivorella]|uniref:uncharacterized protein LOC125242061 n=1 Tax=Leguminivora glycinivorella TaxID=1035111 RepID=UPI00200F9D32|nr:uncharacterized protein LOC125242061 [Leguminivora glycinivorella]